MMWNMMRRGLRGKRERRVTERDGGGRVGDGFLDPICSTFQLPCPVGSEGGRYNRLYECLEQQLSGDRPFSDVCSTPRKGSIVLENCEEEGRDAVLVIQYTDEVLLE
jgi:hypothetical protein